MNPAGTKARNAKSRPTGMPRLIEPMLATLVSNPFPKSGWVYEEKYDGDRILAYKQGQRIRMLSRNAIDRKDRFPRIAEPVFLGLRDDKSPKDVLLPEVKP